MLFVVKFVFDQINTSSGNTELLIGINKVKALFCEQALTQ